MKEIKPLTPMELYRQGKVWQTGDGTWVRIKDMSPRHRINTAKLLMDTASERQCRLDFIEFRFYQHAPEEVFDQWLSEGYPNPRKWMRRTKLYRAMLKDLPVQSERRSPSGLFD